MIKSFGGKIVKNTIAQLVTYAILMVFSLSMNILIGRLWGADMLGQYAFVITFAGLFVFSCDLGLNLLIIREIARRKEGIVEYVTDAFNSALILSLSTIALIVVLTLPLGYGIEIKWCIYFAALWIVLGVLTSILRGAFYAIQKMEYETIAVGVEKSTSLALLIVVLFTQTNLIYLLVALIISRCIAFGVSLIIFSIKIGFFKPRFSFCKDLVRGAIPFGLNTLFTTIYMRADVVILSFMRNNREVGFYRAATVLIIPLPMIAAAFNNSLLPIMSRLHISSRSSLKENFEKSFEYLFILAFPLMVGICILSKKVILALYGTEFLPAAVSLQILSLIIPLRFINNTLGMTLTSTDAQKLRTKSVAIGAAINIGLNLIAIPFLGYIGTSITTVLTEVIIFGFLYFYASRVHQLPILKIISCPISCSLIMGAFLFVFYSANLVFLVILSSLIYIGTFYFVRRYLW